MIRIGYSITAHVRALNAWFSVTVSRPRLSQSSLSEFELKLNFRVVLSKLTICGTNV